MVSVLYILLWIHGSSVGACVMWGISVIRETRKNSYQEFPAVPSPICDFLLIVLLALLGPFYFLHKGANQLFDWLLEVLIPDRPQF
jgi:hypothetical protein